MKVFRELKIQGSKVKIKDTLTKIENRLKDGWIRNRDQENKISSDATNEMYCFSCTDTSSRKAASLWLAYRNDDTLYVSNIIPLNLRQLDVDQYNEIIREFYKKFVAPAAESLTLKHVLTSDTKEIQDWVSTETVAKLQRFARLANKNTGSTHPSDQERWFNFLVAAHAESTTLGPQTLAKWLEETEGWPEEIAYDISIEYEFSQSLLKVYDEKRP